MSSHRLQPIIKTAFLFIFAGVYFILGKFGLSLAFINASASAVWPPTGISLAVLLLLGQWTWPSIFLGAFLVNWSTAGGFATCLGIAAGNTLEAVLGAYLIKRFISSPDIFGQPVNVFKYIVICALSAM